MTAGATTRDATAPAGAAPRWPKALLWLTLGLLVLAPLATLSGREAGMPELGYGMFFRLFFFDDHAASLAMLLAFLVALLVPPLRARIAALAGHASRHPLATAGIAFVALAVLAQVVYRGFPLAMDEFAPLLQARAFASGHLAAEYPPALLDHMVVPGFQGSFLHVNHATGQAVSGYWPGLALLMTPFALVGAEWLLNPLLAALGLLLVGDLARQASGHEDARGWAMLAALASPQYTVNAMSYYAMTGLLTLNLLFLWLLLRPGARNAFLAGVAGSLALVMHNPLPHALFAVPCVLWLLMDRQRRGRLLPLVAGYLPLALLLALGWPLLAASVGLRPSSIPAEQGQFLGSWLQVLVNLFNVPGLDFITTRVYATWKTLIWAAPGLLVLAFVLKPATPVQRLLLAGFLLTYAFYFFIPFDQGHGWGYRYLHPAWGLLPIAAGVFAVAGAGANRNFVAAAIAAGLLATPVFLHNTRGTVALAIEQQPPVPAQGRHLVFIADQPGHYSPDLVRNYPRDAGRLVRLWSRGMDEDRALVARISPAATLVSADRRGSVWSVPAHAPFPWP